MSRRQRKKLRVGALQELVFEISVVFKTTLTLADWDLFIDDFCEYVASIPDKFRSEVLAEAQPI